MFYLGVDKWLTDENAIEKIKSSNLISNFGPYSKEIIDLYKTLKNKKSDKKSAKKLRLT